VLCNAVISGRVRADSGARLKLDQIIRVDMRPLWGILTVEIAAEPSPRGEILSLLLTGKSKLNLGCLRPILILSTVALASCANPLRDAVAPFFCQLFGKIHCSVRDDDAC
jgi:hypothetical protein